MQNSGTLEFKFSIQLIFFYIAKEFFVSVITTGIWNIIQNILSY